jgi:hypothetical protein
VSEADARSKVKSSSRQTASKQAESGGQGLLFERLDASLYTSLAHLPQKAGVAAEQLARLAVKELVDNGLDACDASGRPGAVTVRIEHGNLIIADQGVGIPKATPEILARLFSVARPMLSSKLLRRPSRGAVGNGLRVCLGYLTVTRGRLIVETGNLRVELIPEIDGTSRIGKVTTTRPIAGLRLTAIAGDEPFTDEDLIWAEDAIELAQQSGRPAFTGRPSAHWLDADHFAMLLRFAVGNVSVRAFLAELDGCTGSKVQSQIAAPFIRRAAASLTADEAAQLLLAAQNATRPPKAKTLCPLGRDAVIAAGYAMESGTFTEGAHRPTATLPFIVECWADACLPAERPDHPLIGSFYMNRTKAMAPFSGSVWHGHLNLNVGNASIMVPAPAGPHYDINVAITSPMFRLLSDGKAPDCSMFRAALREAIGTAAKKAGREIAAQMNASERQAAAAERRYDREVEQYERIADREERQQRQQKLADEKAARRALPSIRDVVLQELPEAIEIEAVDGYLFNTRRLLYRIRDKVLRRSGKELLQGTFEKIVTEIEAERGDLHPQLIREARGNFSVPHLGLTIPLGTLNVRQFLRPAWVFNKIVTIEKEDLRLMLHQAGWDERNDALLMSSKGFNTRAARDLIDKIAGTSEPLRVFGAHDADAAGTLIHHTLQHATLARGERAIEITDLGLQPWEGIALGLHVEKVPPLTNKDGTPKRRAVGDYVRQRTDRAPTGETWEQWLQHSRVELNAFTSAELIAWLDRKMEEHGAGKLIPPDDILTDGFGERMRTRAEQAVEAEIERRTEKRVAAIKAARDEAGADIRAEIERITADLRQQLEGIEQPFDQQIEDAMDAAEAVDREAEINAVIEKITPEAERLRGDIGNRFADEPAMPWADVLDDIAAATEIGAIEIDLATDDETDVAPDSDADDDGGDDEK